MAAENTPTAPLAGGPEPADDRMSILQRRLVEIQGTAAAGPSPAPPAPAAPTEAPAAESPLVELPAAGAPELRADQPDGAGVAEGPAALAHPNAPDAGIPKPPPRPKPPSTCPMP